MQDGGKNVDGHHIGQSKSINVEVKAPGGLNLTQVKILHDGSAYYIKESLDKSIITQDDLHSKVN